MRTYNGVRTAPEMHSDRSRFALAVGVGRRWPSQCMNGVIRQLRVDKDAKRGLCLEITLRYKAIVSQHDGVSGDAEFGG
jgi:hypothetical protein